MFEVRGGLRRWEGPTRTCVRVDDSNALFRGFVLEEAFLRAVVASAGQTGEVEEHGDFFRLRGLRRHEEVEVHVAVCGFGGVRELEQLAAEAGYCRIGFQRHVGRDSKLSCVLVGLNESSLCLISDVPGKEQCAELFVDAEGQIAPQTSWFPMVFQDWGVFFF